ncbi:hypothetical protein Ancab_039265 [Ancistrocladus abbreviatus]
MEAMRMILVIDVVMMLIAVFSVQNAAAVEAPAPSPTSDTAVFVPSAFATLFVIVVVMMLIAVFSVQNAAAVEAPAPSPTSNATVFVPSAFAALFVLAFGLFF